MKRISFSPTFDRKLKELKNKNPALLKKIHKQLKLFRENPRHKSLRLHKIKRKNEQVWSISIDKGFRMLYIENDEIYFFEIGTHDEVYRK